jgi:hypothetical protein
MSVSYIGTLYYQTLSSPTLGGEFFLVLET